MEENAIRFVNINQNIDHITFDMITAPDEQLKDDRKYVDVI